MYLIKKALLALSLNIYRSIPDLWNRKTIRTVRFDGDRVYLDFRNKLYWIKNVETLEKLGFKLGDEVTIVTNSESNWEYGEPIDLTFSSEKKIDEIAQIVKERPGGETNHLVSDHCLDYRREA